jgi:hypothetical protein
MHLVDILDQNLVTYSRIEIGDLFTTIEPDQPLIAINKGEFQEYLSGTGIVCR